MTILTILMTTLFVLAIALTKQIYTQQRIKDYQTKQSDENVSFLFCANQANTAETSLIGVK